MRKPSIIPKPLWLAAGWMLSVMGVVGFILPMMPGLVFFILASYCFARSSPRFLRRIIGHPVIGPQIMDWKRGKGMLMKTKITAIALVSFSLTFSAFFLVKLIWVKWIIMVSMVGIVLYILSVKTRKPLAQICTTPTNQGV